MEKGNTRIIRSTKEEWKRRKELLGFSEPIPEFSRVRIRKFLPDLIVAQTLLEAFENSQTDSLVLEKLRHGLFERQHSIIKRFKLALEAKNIEKEKHDLISIIIDVFLDCSIKIKAVLSLMEQEYQATNAYKILQKLSIILEKFISDLEQSAPQNAEQIISEFRKSLSEIIEITKK